MYHKKNLMISFFIILCFLNVLFAATGFEEFARYLENYKTKTSLFRLESSQSNLRLNLKYEDVFKSGDLVGNEK